MNLRAIQEGIGKGIGEKIGEAIVAGISAVALLIVAGLIYLFRHNPILLVVFAVIALFLLSVSGFLLWVLLRKRISKPVESTPRPLTPQEIRQQKVNDQMKFLEQFQKPSPPAFELLKFLAMNARDGSVDAQSAASLFCNGSLAAAQDILSELRAANYIERAGPAMPGEGNNHYRINQRGLTCVDLQAA